MKAEVFEKLVTNALDKLTDEDIAYIRDRAIMFNTHKCTEDYDDNPSVIQCVTL